MIPVLVSPFELLEGLSLLFTGQCHWLGCGSSVAAGCRGRGCCWAWSNCLGPRHPDRHGNDSTGVWPMVFVHRKQGGLISVILQTAVSNVKSLQRSTFDTMIEEGLFGAHKAAAQLQALHTAGLENLTAVLPTRNLGRGIQFAAQSPIRTKAWMRVGFGCESLGAVFLLVTSPALPDRPSLHSPYPHSSLLSSNLHPGICQDYMSTALPPWLPATPSLWPVQARTSTTTHPAPVPRPSARSLISRPASSTGQGGAPALPSCTVRAPISCGALPRPCKP